jgi:hypothetical protein
MFEMIQEAHTQLHEGCPTSCLVAILLLLKTLTTHGVSNTFVDELFTHSGVTFSLKITPCPSQLMYQAKRIVQWLGLNYNSIHVCYNGGLV